MLKGRAQYRFWFLFAILFALIAVEGGVGLYVLAEFKRSGDHLQRVENAGLFIDELGLTLNNFVKEMKISTGLSQQGGKAVPLPPTQGLAEGTRRLREASNGLGIPSVTRLVAGSEALMASVAVYSQKLSANAMDDATLLYIQNIEPGADQLLETDFPEARTALMSELEGVASQNREAAVVARRFLVLSLLGTLAVGLFLVRLIARTLTQASRQDAELQRRNSEMAIARTIQSSVIPHDLTLPGFDIAAAMKPAAEVGGDFYEFRRTPDGGAWLGIGDVTGHGITAGLIMMMTQSMFTMLSEAQQDVPLPASFLARLNRALFFNLNARLGEERFVTMVIARVFPDGRMIYAGAHTDLLIYRHRTATVERLATDGLWLGLLEDIAPVTRDYEVTLQPGDLALFHTDGVTEARNERGELFDIHRVMERLHSTRGGTASDTVANIMSDTLQWSPVPADDLSLIAIRRSHDGT